MRDNRIDPSKLFFRTTITKEVFDDEERIKVTRKEAREHLEQLKLACELSRLLRHFFPDLLPMLRQLPDPRNQSYITYPVQVLLMTRILSAIFYISSMRKTSEEFNSDTVIENIWHLCGESPQSEIPYWETINRYLKKLDPEEMQKTIWQLCRRLLRSRAFDQSRIRGKYWQVIVDGTRLCSSRGGLDGKSLYRIHNKGTDVEYRENYYYVVEAKLVLAPKILVSIMTEFVENKDGGEVQKQDCESKACMRLMERLKREFPRLRVCLCADSLYASERFFRECQEKGWHYILRFKEGSIPGIAEEFQSLKEGEKNGWEKKLENGEAWYDYVTEIDYRGYKINLVEYMEECIRKAGKKETCREKKKFWFITDLPITRKNAESLVEAGRARWKIENEGFNTQKRQGYHLEHMYSKNYQAVKNHYYLIQIGHMISQIMEAWEKLWKKVKQSREQRHKRVLESFKRDRIEKAPPEKRQQIRLILS